MSSIKNLHSFLISGGGGIGAKAEATIDQGVITGISITDPGKGYTSPPNVIFTKLVQLKRKTRARQALQLIKQSILLVWLRVLVLLTVRFM